MDDGTVYTTSQTAATRSASNVALSSVGFTLAGTNGQGVVLALSLVFCHRFLLIG